MKKDAVALVDWNWTGHHPSYFTFFLEALLGLGLDVVGLCPEPEEALRLLGSRLKGGSQADWERRVVLGPIAKTRYRLSNRAGSLLAPVSRVDWTVRRFVGLESRIRRSAGSERKRMVGMIYPCIYDVDFRDVAWVDRWLRYPWAGLYVHANSLRIPPAAQAHPQNHPLPERMFAGSMCRGLGLLDEGLVDEVGVRTGKSVVHFPDVTDAGFGADPPGPSLASRLLEFAEGRKVVGVFGHLIRSKGVLDLLEVARMPEMQEVCFAFTGKLGSAGYTPEETGRILKDFRDLPNVWAHPERVPEEADLNRLMSVCDVIAACYTDFPHSSNVLTKAAALRRPVIVNDGFLMAERVRRHSLGEVICQGDSNALCRAIRRLLDGGKDSARFGWDAYAELNSFRHFESAVAKLVGCIDAISLHKKGKPLQLP